MLNERMMEIIEELGKLPMESIENVAELQAELKAAGYTNHLDASTDYLIVEKYEMTREDAKMLGRITTRDEAETHFTQIYDAKWLDNMEAAGYLSISKPIHTATGIAYDQKEWAVEVTPDGIEIGEGMNWGE